MDRNAGGATITRTAHTSLSARRAWIEMPPPKRLPPICPVALRKESVDRNFNAFRIRYRHIRSLSARRAWIEIDSEP